MSDEIRRIGVIGAGQMGHGIAHVAAQAGIDVLLHDVRADLIQKGLTSIERNLQKGVDKGKLDVATMQAALARLRPAGELRELGGCDLIVEAVVESIEIKRQLFAELDRLARPGAILASNTSSISITLLGRATERPMHVIGMHFMNPVPLMRLVEVVRGLATSDETTATVVELAGRMGKTPIECRDFPGFISNRVLLPMINEAIYCLHEGVGDVAAIDGIMKLGMNHPMGPLALADLIGLDTCLAIMGVLQEGLGDSKYRACPLLRKYVEAGWLGRKTGRGFYDYSTSEPAPLPVR